MQFFSDHPPITLVDYCTKPDISVFLHNWTTAQEEGFEPDNLTLFANETDTSPAKLVPPSPFGDEPNTAYKSFILQFGTFWIAYYLRIFRNGKALGRTVNTIKNITMAQLNADIRQSEVYWCLTFV